LERDIELEKVRKYALIFLSENGGLRDWVN